MTTATLYRNTVCCPKCSGSGLGERATFMDPCACAFCDGEGYYYPLEAYPRGESSQVIIFTASPCRP